LAVSLSSLEKDPLEMAGGNEPGGFPAYGFKGAGDNRTGIYTPEAKAADAKAKLRLLLGVAGVLVLLLGLVGLFIFLRGNAAGKAQPAAENQAAEPDAAETRGTPEAASREEAHPAAQSPAAPSPSAHAQPYPEAASPEAPAPHAEAAPPREETGYSEPPMPVEPPRPGAAPENRPASPPATPKAPKTAYRGNTHVTPEREAALMAMVQTRIWPNSAAERLKAADDLNDLGKTAEATWPMPRPWRPAG
jgi:hypothetical protein